MNRFSALPVGAAVVCVLAAAPCGANVHGEQTLEDSPPLAVAAIERFELPVLAEVRRGPFDSRPLAARHLASRRGGDGVFNHNKLKGVVADNSASNLTTGTNVISEGAFAGSSGLPTVIQNSGNNVLIQNSTIVNVQIK